MNMYVSYSYIENCPSKVRAGQRAGGGSGELGAGGGAREFNI